VAVPVHPPAQISVAAGPLRAAASFNTAVEPTAARVTPAALASLACSRRATLRRGSPFGR
jgi:hypothetical protein